MTVFLACPRFLTPKKTLAMAGEHLEEIDSPADLVWYMNHSRIFNHTIMGYANRFLYSHEDMIRGNLERHLNKEEKGPGGEAEADNNSE